MIESVEELESILTGIETNLKACEVLQKEYANLPRWAILRQQKNLKSRRNILDSNASLWDRLNEGIDPSLGVEVTSTFVWGDKKYKMVEIDD